MWCNYHAHQSVTFTRDDDATGLARDDVSCEVLTAERNQSVSAACNDEVALSRSIVDDVSRYDLSPLNN